MKLLKIDKLIPLVTISLMVLFSFMLYADFMKKYTQSKAGEIGTLTYKKLAAERRFADEVLWEDIDQNSKVYNCDYLRTTNNSGAVVHLKDNTNIEIGENTLILICYTEHEVHIDLGRGSLAARRTAGDRIMNITSGNSSINVDRGVLSVDKTKTRLNVSVSMGSAELTVGGKKNRVDPGKEATVSENSVTISKTSTIQLTPDLNQYFVTADTEYPVRFTWESEGTGPFLVQAAKDNAFTAIAGQARVGQKSAVLAVAAGSYFWRLIDERGKAGPVRSFNVVRDYPAEQISPASQQNFAYRNTSPLVTFSWKPAAAATSYSIDIGTDPALGKTVLSLNSDGVSIATEALKPGTYFWRIRNRYGFNPDAVLASPVRQFSVVKAGGLAAPETLVPKDGDAASTLSLASGKTLFNWKSDPGFVSYDFHIAQDESFKNMVYRERVQYNFHQPRAALAPGIYFWSVGGISGDGISSPRSRPQRFTVTRPQPPALTGPEADAAINPAESKEMRFTWSDVPGGQRFRFELSPDADFKKIIRSDTITEPSRAMTAPAPGNYFWRVTIIDDGGAIASMSKIRRFTVTESLDPPAGMYPANNEVITVTQRSGLAFKWNPVKGATHYRLLLKEIDGNRERAVLNTRVDAAQYNLKKIELLDAGQFAWEVSAVKQTGTVVKAESRSGRNYFSISAGKRLKTPKLKSNVIYVE